MLAYVIIDFKSSIKNLITIEKNILESNNTTK